MGQTQAVVLNAVTSLRHLALDLQGVNTGRIPEQDSRRNKLRNLYEEGFEGRWLCADLLALQASCPGDSVLRDVLTPRKLRHNLPVIFHFDDFQFSIEALADNVQYSQPTRVTIHGIQSVLGVISTPNNALFAFTGSWHLSKLDSLGAMFVRDFFRFQSTTQTMRFHNLRCSVRTAVCQTG